MKIFIRGGADCSARQSAQTAKIGGEGNTEEL